MATALAANMSVGGQRPGASLSVAPQQLSEHWLPPVPASSDAMPQHAGMVSYHTMAYNCAIPSYWQSSAPIPTPPPPPLPPRRSQPSVQGPVTYLVGECTAVPGRGANGTPYAVVAGNSSARVQAPVLRHTALPGAQMTASAGIHKAHETPGTAEDSRYGRGLSPAIEQWLNPQSESCPPQAQPARTADAAQDAMAPQAQAQHQPLQRQTRLAAASTRSADEAAADGGVAQSSGSPAPVLLSGRGPAHAPLGAEAVAAEPTAEQHPHAAADSAADSDASGPVNTSAGSPGHPAGSIAELFGCLEPSVEEVSSNIWSLVGTDGSNSQSEAASASQVAGDSTELTLGSPPLSPASKAASSLPSCTASPAAGSHSYARGSDSEHAEPSPPPSVAASVDAAHSDRGNACEYTDSELRRITAGSSPLGSVHDLGAPGPAMTGSYAVRIVMAAPTGGLRVAARPCAAVQPASPTPAEVAARLAALVATHGDLLDTAPADRLPLADLASPEGSPEPEGLPEGIVEGLLGGDGEDENDDPVEEGTGPCAEPAAAVGAAARPKRTAGGDPMDVRLFPHL